MGHGPVVDPLEPRILLAGISLVLSRGTLKVTGTGAADVIVLRQKSAKLSVLGVRKSFATALVKRVQINGGGGDDQIRIDSSARSLKFGFKLVGGAGNDSLVGSARADSL